MSLSPPASDEELSTVLRYTEPGAWPSLARYPIGAEHETELLARMFVQPQAKVLEMLGAMDQVVQAAAAELLADPTLRAAVEALPLKPQDRLVVVGDSLSADQLGWFRILTAAFARAGRTDIQTANIALSGDTTADVIERFDLIQRAAPTHVLVMLGTNDARVHGRGIGHRMVTPQETRRNLGVLLDLIERELGATVVLLTPPPADQLKIDAFFQGALLRWSARDLEEMSDLVLSVGAAHIDLHAALKARSQEDFLEADGVHLNLRGQVLAARHILVEFAAAFRSASQPRRA